MGMSLWTVKNFVQAYQLMAVLFLVRRLFVKVILVVSWYATSTDMLLLLVCYQDKLLSRITVAQMVTLAFSAISIITQNGYNKVF